MHVIQAAILGLIQGLTEFVPVSSSAHLVVVPWLLGWDEPVFRSLGFDVALHMGTLVGLVAFFWRDFVRMIAAWLKSLAERRLGGDPDGRMAWYILAACLPGALAGVLFEGGIEELFHPANSPIEGSSMLAMAAVVALLGLLLLVAEKGARHERPLEELRWRDALLIGLSQALAIFPGVSRSGATITAGLALGLKREAAARFSFLLSAPIIAGAGAKSLYDLARGGFGASGAATAGGAWAMAPVVAAGFVAAAVSGFLCIKFLLDFLQKRTTAAFVYYRWAFAALIAVAALAGY
jgi:undecaprenyl-diphosphatase